MTTTSHDIDVTSRNQPHYLISRHFTTNHIVSFNPATNHIKTGHHIAAMERLKARSHKKLGLGIALVGRLCAHSMGQNIRPACPALLAYTEWNTCIMCIEYAGALWALCPFFFLAQLRIPHHSFHLVSKIVEQKLQIPHANWNFDASSHQPSDAFSDPGPLPQKSCAMTPWTKYP